MRKKTKQSLEQPPLGWEMVAEKFCDAMEPHADKLGEGALEMIHELRASLKKLEALDVEAYELKQKLARLRGEPRAPTN